MSDGRSGLSSRDRARARKRAAREASKRREASKLLRDAQPDHLVASTDASGGSRKRLIAGLAGAALVIAIAVLSFVVLAPGVTLPSTSSETATPAIGQGALGAIQARPHLLFQNVMRDEDYAKISVIPLDATDSQRISSDLICERVHFAGGRGLCLAGEHLATSTYHAQVFQGDFVPGPRIPLAGTPSLARVSSDGRYGAASVVTDQLTEEDATTPTQTLLIDMVAGTVIADLEEFAVSRDGAELTADDLDYWGVTFQRDSNRFYATLRTEGNTYLVEGDIAARQMEVRHQNVSSPSLSPDQNRIGFVKVISNIGPTLRFHVLDLATMVETPLAETTSIDDQLEWLDDSSVIYGLATDLYAVPADGSGEPRLFLSGGLSPAVVR